MNALAIKTRTETLYWTFTEVSLCADQLRVFAADNIDFLYRLPHMVAYQHADHLTY